MAKRHDGGYATVQTYKYFPMSFSSTRLRVRRGEDIKTTWNTGGRVMCILQNDDGYRYPSLGFFARVFGPATYLPVVGSTTLRITKEQKLSLICEDPGIYSTERGVDGRSLRIRLVPFYPKF